MKDFRTVTESIRILLLLIQNALSRGLVYIELTTYDIFYAISARDVAVMAGCSHQTIYRLLDKLLAIPEPVPDLLSMDKPELLTLLYPKAYFHTTKKRRPPYEVILKERQKRPKKYGKNIKTIKLEYNRVDPSTALSDSRFYQLVRQYLRNHKIDMYQPVEPGEAMYVDFAGMPVFFWDGDKKVTLHVFVAVMGYSKKMFACTSFRQDAVGWISCLEKALRFFGRAPVVVHFDNAKAVVRKPGLVADLSDRANDFSRFHNLLCDTSAVGTPKHNRDAEKSVQFIENRILTVLRGLEYYSQKQVDNSILEMLADLNSQPFQKYPFSRDELFNKYESPALTDLATQSYPIYIKKSIQTVTSNHTVHALEHEYSVPWEYAKHQVTVVIFTDIIRVYDCLKLIAEHAIVRNPLPKSKTILPEHMPVQHQHQAKKNKTEFLRWAHEVGPATVDAVEAIYKRFKSETSKPGGKRCLMLKKFASTYTPECLERVLKSMRPFDDLPDIEEIKMLLSAGSARQSVDIQPEKLLSLAGKADSGSTRDEQHG